MSTTDLFAVANVRRAYWREHDGLHRRISEAEFVARGYDRDLLLAIGVPIGVAPKLARYQREPGEDAFEEAAA